MTDSGNEQQPPVVPNTSVEGGAGTAPASEAFPAFGQPGTTGGPSDPGRAPAWNPAAAPPDTAWPNAGGQDSPAATQTTTMPAAVPAGAAGMPGGASTLPGGVSTMPATMAGTGYAGGYATSTGPIVRPFPLMGLTLVGLLTALLGAWAGLSVLVGPSFGWSPDGTPSWKFGIVHVVLHIIPGAAALLAGIVMLAVLPRSARGEGRMAGCLAGILAILAAIWLVCGPFYWPVVRPRDVVFVGSSSQIQNFTYVIGPNVGVGLLIAILGAFVVAWATRRPKLPVV